MAIDNIAKSIERTGRVIVIMSTLTFVIVLINIFFKVGDKKEFISYYQKIDSLQHLVRHELSNHKAEHDLIKLAIEQIKAEMVQNKIGADVALKALEVKVDAFIAEVRKDREITYQRRKEYDIEISEWRKRREKNNEGIKN